MIKNIFAFFAFSTILLGCGGDDEQTTVLPIVNSCGNAISSFTVVQDNSNVNINLVSNTTGLIYEISFVNSNNTQDANNGFIVTLDQTNEVLDLADSNLESENSYSVYSRTICSDGSKSDWSTPKAFYITEYCGEPTNLSMSLFSQGWGFSWTSADNANAYYQVEYGTQGFTQGTGTTANVNTTYFVGSMLANTTYDYYVRSYCTSATGWSSWAGPYTYFSESNQNQCTQPSNVQYSQLSSSSANFTWNYNGESYFEYALVGGSQTINTATIYSISTFSTPTFTGISNFAQYTFYVRAICANGNRTPWTTILVDLN